MHSNVAVCVRRVNQVFVIKPSAVLNSCTLRWSDEGEARLTVVVKVALSLVHQDVARLVEPEPIADDERAPWKPALEVTVSGSMRHKGRIVVGAAIARGHDVLWGKRRVVEDQETARFDERCAVFLAGGEQILIVGYGDHDRMCRLPASRPHAMVDDAPVPLIGDSLHIDADRMTATLLWRGHIASPDNASDEADVALSWAPLVAAEEIVGSPVSWRRTLWRAHDGPPKILGDGPLRATTLPPSPTGTPLVVKATFDLNDDTSPTLSDDQERLSGDIHHGGAPATSLRYPSDVVPCKEGVDVVATGYIYAPDGAAVAESRLVLGSIDKRIAAVGKRRWRGNTLGAPEPFERIALRYENAFGGPGFDPNPFGTGIDGTDPPTLERLDDALASPDQRPRPGCLSPIRAAAGKGGTFDAAWIASGRPEPPKDFDKTVFNAAPSDQRCAALEGDEAFSLTGTRKDGKAWRGSLPGLVPRCFWLKDDEVVSMAMTLDTVVFDTERAKLLLVWRGRIEGSPPYVWSTFGPLDDRPPPAEIWGELTTARDRRFEPTIAEGDETLAAVRARLDEVAKEHRALLMPLGPFPREIPAASRREIVAWLEDDALSGRDLSRADLRGLDLGGKDLSRCVLAGAQLDGARFEGANCRQANLASARGEEVRFAGADLSGVDATGATLLRADFSRAQLEDATFEDAVLSGALFTEARLGRAAFVRARLQDATLEGAQAERADLSGAAIDRASFRKAKLDDAKLYDVEGVEVAFDEASLINARLERAQLPQASLSEARASGSMWEGANLTGARLQGADLSGASMNGVLLDGAVLNQIDARRMRLRGASLCKAALLKADLMEGDLSGADLRGADLRGANLYSCDTHAALLDGANLDLAHVAKTQLAGQ